MSTRREFLILTTMTAAAAAAIGPKLFAAAPAAAPRLAVGFAPLDAGTLADAANVPSPDGTFISRGARVTFAGVRNMRRAAELTASFPYFDGATKRVAPFRVWARGGNGLSFTMPADVEQKLTFNVVAGESTLPVTLTLLSDANALKLVRGFYILTPLFDKETAPRWSGYQLRDVGGRWTVCDAKGNPAAFEHFVLRVDYDVT